jgi:hypothetical protein
VSGAGHRRRHYIRALASQSDASVIASRFVLVSLSSSRDRVLGNGIR